MTKGKVAALAEDEAAGDPDVSAPLHSEEDIALTFAKQEFDALRYVHQWGNWLWWDGRRWHRDTTMLAFSKVRKLCRLEAQNLKPNTSHKIASAKTVAAVERLAKADRRLAATTDQWDTDKMLLNTPDGVVDLRTGKLGESKPDYYMTKVTAVSPGGKCPLFMKFLNRIMEGDAEMIAYLQRVFGYCLTGETKEHAMFDGYGPGGNGKGRLLFAISGIMGSYHKAAAAETFTATNHIRPNSLSFTTPG